VNLPILKGNLMLEKSFDFKNRIAEISFGFMIFLWAFHMIIMNFWGSQTFGLNFSIVLSYIIILAVLTSASSLSYSNTYRELILKIGYYSWIFLTSICVLTGGPFYFIYTYMFFAIFSAFLGLRLKCRRVW
jgi:hypothetical protein